jgi:hypothetical protein
LVAHIARCQLFIDHGLLPLETFVETYTTTSGAYTYHANRPLAVYIYEIRTLEHISLRNTTFPENAGV